MEIIETEIDKISITQDRFRKEMGDINGLAESIKLNGLLVPIVINENKHLIAGERRLTACKLLQWKTIPARVMRANEIQHRIFEIIENIDRKDFTWQESVIATEELHKMLLAEHGAKWTIRKTADRMGIATAYGEVAEHLQLAKALKEAPDVFEGCKSKFQALKALKKYAIDEAKAELMLRRTKSNFSEKARNMVFKGDCLQLMDRLPQKHVDFLISDPIYGVDFFKNKFINREVPQTFYKETFDDTKENFDIILPQLIKKASKVLKENSGVLMFCGFQNAQMLIDLWSAEGYNMDVLPGIWTRNVNAGRTNCPSRYFNRCYDMFVYGMRGEITMAHMGGGNVIEASSISTQEREHPSEKPIALMEELISRLCLPGYVVLDPMCGCGSTLVAALKRACIPIGFEIDETYYEKAVVNVVNALQFKDAGKADLIGRRE